MTAKQLRQSSKTLRNLTGKKPAGSSMKLATRKSIGLSKVDTKKRLLLIATMAEILHQKSNTFEDKKLSAQLAKIYKDLKKMVAVSNLQLADF